MSFFIWCGDIVWFMGQGMCPLILETGYTGNGKIKTGEELGQAGLPLV